MTLGRAHKLMKKFYLSTSSGKQVKQEELNELGDFLHQNRYRLLILREFGVTYDPSTKAIVPGHYPMEIHCLAGFLHYEKFES